MKERIDSAVLNADSPQIQPQSLFRRKCVKSKKKASSSVQPASIQIILGWDGKFLTSDVVNYLTWSRVFHYETISYVICCGNDVVSWYRACFTASEMEFCAEKCCESIITQPKCFRFNSNFHSFFCPGNTGCEAGNISCTGYIIHTLGESFILLMVWIWEMGKS